MMYHMCNMLFKMVTFQQKNYETCKEIGKCNPYIGKKSKQQKTWPKTVQSNYYTCIQRTKENNV